MDGKRFDAIARTLAFSRDRRGIARLLAAGALGGMVLAGASDIDAKRKKKKRKKKKNKNNNKKITICHKGQTITVSKNAQKGHLKHGDTLGECPAPPPPPPRPGTSCTDGVQNGTETDVDCGGGSCPRCGVGKKCSTRNDCATGLCDNGVCKSCVLNDDCGLDADGVSACACRDSRNIPGMRYCSNFNGGTSFPGDACNNCTANQGCTAINGDVDSECVRICGAT